MKNLHSKYVSFVTAVATLATLIAPFAVRAADLPPVSMQMGEWGISTLAKNGNEWKIEGYKADRSLAAWTEVNVAGTRRRLFVFDGAKSRLLAEMPVSDWDNKDPYFVDGLSGSFDAADGLVVWIMKDGNDREVFAFDGDAVKKVSDNTYDDRHPVTGGGRIAWSSYPSDSQYNLMVKETDGKLNRVASWQTMNYAFSGKNLFWMAYDPAATMSRVYRNDGKLSTAIGKGDDRPLTKYFITDGKGTAGWEFSTKEWTDKREYFISYQGNPALRVMTRVVPPITVRMEDVLGSRMMLNVYDWQYRRVTEWNTLTIADFTGETAVSQKEAMSKVRFMDDGYVMQREPEANINLVLVGDNGEDLITEGAVIKDIWDADGATAAGALVGGGLAIYSDGKRDVIGSTVESTDVVVSDGDVLWTEGSGDAKTLKFAGKTVVVKTAYGAKRATGFLVKSTASAAVYLAADDGRRYLFPSSKQFYDWYDGFDSVRSVSPAALAKMPLAGSVLFRGGERLLKTKTASKVYAVGDFGHIYALTSENAAKEIFGNDWKSRITVVGDSALTDYSVGPSVTDRLSYFATLAKQVNR